MTRAMARAREGFSLVELLVALSLTAVIGAAMTGLFVSQARLLEQQQKQEFARGVTRSASNILMSELRMVERDSGVVAASASSITIRAPYAMGIVCAATGALLTLSMLPVDQMMYDSARVAGFAYRKTDGTYHYTANTTTLPAVPTSTACATAGITVISGGTIRTIATTQTPTAGAPVLLYQTIRYHFAASAAVPGRRGLYRAMPAISVDEEIVAPFDTSARFNYFVSDAEIAQAAAPSPLRLITGVEIVMNGVSERPNANGTYTRVPLRTAVFFKNRRN